MTSAFKNETIDHCLTAYQHRIDYGKAYLISPQRNKRCQVTEIVCPFFRFAEVAILEERSEPPSPHRPPAMHIPSVSTSAFIKTCDTSVDLKLQCLKIQTCSQAIISVQSSCLMDILWSGPLRSLHHGSATKLEKSNRFNRLNIWHKQDFGLIQVSGKLPTYPSPKPLFCPK